MNRSEVVNGTEHQRSVSANRGTAFKEMSRATRFDVHMGIVIVALLLVLSVPFAFAGDETGHWIGTWAAAPAFVDGNTQYTDQTLRFIVHTSLGGGQIRVRFSNVFGSQPLKIGSAHVALRQSDAKIVVNTDRVLTFGGRPFIEVPVGALVLSDTVHLRVPPLSDLAVSLYLPQPSTADTSHIVALQTSFVAQGLGDFTGSVDLPGAAQTFEWDFLTGVDVREDEHGAAIVAVGDSVTDGIGSTFDANRRWTDVLASRLVFHEGGNVSVLNEGHTGNRLLHNAPEGISFFGPAGLARFERDVLGQAGVKYLIVSLGLNDFAQVGIVAPLSEDVSVEDLIAGHLQIIERAHEKGILAYGCTLTPFEDSLIAPGFFTPEKELTRQAFNHWIRTSGAYDAVLDFDKVVRDPTHPTRIRPEFDSGDHTHPNDAGYRAIGQSINLKLFAGGND